MLNYTSCDHWITDFKYSTYMAVYSLSDIPLSLTSSLNVCNALQLLNNVEYCETLLNR